MPPEEGSRRRPCSSEECDSEKEGVGADPGSGQDLICRRKSTVRRSKWRQDEITGTDGDVLLGLVGLESDLSGRPDVRRVVLVPLSLRCENENGISFERLRQGWDRGLTASRVGMRRKDACERSRTLDEY